MNAEIARRHTEQFIAAYPGFRTEGCILCDAPVAFMGLFFPPKRRAKVLGEPTGKNRGFAYGVCRDCAELKNNEELVEDEILGRLMANV